MREELVTAFKSIAPQSVPPPEPAGLSYSQRRIFQRALDLYSSLPESPSEIREAFHCSMDTATKVHQALNTELEKLTRRAKRKK